MINPFEIQFDPGEALLLNASTRWQEAWRLHDAVEVGGGDLEERAQVAAFDQEPKTC